MRSPNTATNSHTPTVGSSAQRTTPRPLSRVRLSPVRGLTTANAPTMSTPATVTRIAGFVSDAYFLANRIAAEKPRAHRPESTPTAAAAARFLPSKPRTPSIASRGVVSSRVTNTRYPDTAATRAGNRDLRPRSSRKGDSSANTAPVAGALKIAAMPAAAPATSRVLRLPRKRGGRRLWMDDPIVAPM